MRVVDALALARRIGVDRLDAQLLLAHQLGRPRSWLIAHDDETLPPDVEAVLVQRLQRRADGVPLAYLLGRKEFRGLDLAVSAAVLVPRPETEHLVDWALQCLPPGSPHRVLDLGTGSGAVAIAVAKARPDTVVDASDIDPSSLDLARSNVQAAGASVRFLRGSWWQAVAGQRYRLVLSNPPYIAEDDPHLTALRHEPRHALVSGSDGLDALRIITAQAPLHLEPGGWLLVEHGHDQGLAVRELLMQAGLVQASTRQDLAGLDRCSGAQRPAGATGAAEDRAFAV